MKAHIPKQNETMFWTNWIAQECVVPLWTTVCSADIVLLNCWANEDQTWYAIMPGPVDQKDYTHYVSGHCWREEGACILRRTLLQYIIITRIWKKILEKFGISPNISPKSSFRASWPKWLLPLCFWTLHTMHTTPIHTPVSCIYESSYETLYFFHPNWSCILVWRMYSHTQKVTVVLPQDDPSSIRSKTYFVLTHR